ncbi:WD40 repeat protein/transcriptional regulator with XRE-family HTH domain [Streptomyces africanus]|uniref:WD40 repeat protein/transcriptional regulator with XRE-family HTH domain n=1 Tax=Streptomyces africanus TaxID=231024 RepID=A0ABU0R228_9ACTN|nr:helix-turn-helix domain-containing protein [Streptomyces africanus]MDQ0753340.1 WD40 repeat protein/transcriptional regulator with XRE-family HTH domain [Streptomyces africanus]
MGRREKPVDPDAGPVQRLAHDLRVLREKAGKPPYREIAQRAGYSITAVSQAAAGEQLPSLAVVRAYAEALDGDPDEWERRWRKADAEVRAPAPDERPPYRGLARFEPDDSDLFFGREGLVTDLRELVREHRFAAVFGASGSGKSSLLRAGLIPRLRQAAGAERPAVIRVLTPGERPARTHQQALVARDGDAETWVIVDQFEELFTLCHDRAERDRFLALLLAALRPESRLRIVVAVRGDFYGHCADHRELAEAVCRANLLVGPLGRDELREVITGPAGTAGLTVERALTARIVDEVVDQPGALPMLSHALLETWRRRRGRMLTLAAYEEAGGVRGAIAATAEEAYGGLPAEQGRVARRILLRLIAPGDGTADTRRPASRAELGSGARDVLERLAAARLVTLDGDSVELAHEALITGWPRLAGWIEEGRDRLRAQRRLGEAARGWEELERDPGALYRGARLARAEELFARRSDGGSTGRIRPEGGPAWSVRRGGELQRVEPDDDPTRSSEPDDDLTPLERAFLTASLAARGAELEAESRAARRTRFLGVGLAVGLVLALAAGLIAWQRDRVSEEEAAKATARRLATVADSLRSTDPRTAALLGAAAWKTAPLTESRSALLGALAQPERDAFTDPRVGRDVRHFLTDGGRTLLSADDGTVTVRNVADHKVTATHHLPSGTEVVAAGPGSRFLDVMAPDGDEKLWSLPRGGSVAELGDVSLQGSADDGSAYLTGPLDGPGTVRLHRANDGKVLFSTGMPRPLSSVAVGPGGRLLALCPAGGPLQLWDAARGKRLPGDWEKADKTLCGTGTGADGGSRLLRFSPDGKRLAAVYGTTAVVWDVASGRTLGDFTSGDDVGFTQAGLSPDGEFLATADDHELAVWRLATGGTQVFHRPLSGADMRGLTWDAGSHRLLRYLDGATVHTLDLTDRLTPRWQSTPADASLLSPDGAALATVTRSGGGYRFELRSTRTGTVRAHATLGPLSNLSDEETPLPAFSPDGRTLAVADTASTHGSPRLRFTVWDVGGHRVRTVIDTSGAADRPATALALGPGGRTLLAVRDAAGSQVTEVWDTRNHRRSRAIPGPSGAGLTVRPDGGLLVGSDDQYADPVSGKVTGRALADGREVTALAFSPDGSRLAVGDTTGHVTLWDGDLRHRAGALTGTSDTVSEGEPEAVEALAFSSDGSTLAVGGANGTLRLWDTGGQQLLGSDLPTPGDEIRSLAFAEDGGTVYASGPNVPLQRFPVAPDQAVRTICARAGGGLTETQWRTYVPDAPYEPVCGD